MVLNIDEIKEIIPHRTPFLLIDRIEEMEAGVRAVGKKCPVGNVRLAAGARNANEFSDFPTLRHAVTDDGLRA